jgi:hypothetical protein
LLLSVLTPNHKVPAGRESGIRVYKSKPPFYDRDPSTLNDRQRKEVLESKNPQRFLLEIKWREVSGLLEEPDPHQPMFRLLILQLEEAHDAEAELLQQLYGSHHYSSSKKQLSLELVDSVEIITLMAVMKEAYARYGPHQVSSTVV